MAYTSIDMDAIDELIYEASEDIANATALLYNWNDISAKERFFGESEEAEAENANTAKASGNFLTNAINKIKTAIGNLIENIKKMFLSKEERAKYEQFKKMVESNPEFAGKKVTIKDFRKSNAELEKALKIVDDGLAQIDRANADQAGSIADSILDKANKYCTAAGKTAQNTITVDAMLRLAQNSRPAAEAIKKMLESEQGMMDKLEAELGKAQAQKFKKEIDRCSRKISLHNFKLKILRTMGKDVGLSGTIDQVMGDMKALLNPDMSVGSNIERAKRGKLADYALGTFNQHADTNYRKRDVVGGAMNLLGSKKRAERKAEKLRAEAERKYNETKKKVDRARKEGQRFLTH